MLGAAPAAMAAGNGSHPGDSWASIAKLPDWSGIWDIDWASIFGPGGSKPQLTPAYAAKLKAYTDSMKEGENTQSSAANCLPPGIPGIMAQPYPIEFLFTPGKVTIAIEAYNQMRRVFTDGRPHPADPDPLWYGHSIGHWEGDTLVVDTVGFDPHTDIAPGVGHTDKMHIVERIRKVSPEKIEITTTIEDPEVLTQPWTFTRPYIHKVDDIREYICEQNNHDASDAEGHPSMKLNN
jgi:hypothetical protein